MMIQVKDGFGVKTSEAKLFLHTGDNYNMKYTCSICIIPKVPQSYIYSWYNTSASLSKKVNDTAKKKNYIKE